MDARLSGKHFAAIAAGVILGCLSACSHAPAPTVGVEPAPAASMAPAGREADSGDFARIDEVAKQEIASGRIPGAVVLVGHNGGIVYRKAFGNRSLEPRPQPMTEDTVFDIASLTKVVATTTAIMQLADRGLLRIDDPVSAYWPEFAANGKGRITIRQLMTHTSGLRPDIDPRVRWSGYEGALSVITADRPIHPPGTEFHYSDINFIVLGEVTRRLSGLPLEVYCKKMIFEPLGMQNTSFRPAGSLQSRIAPCDVQNGCLRWGEVQDPTTYRMGGVAGHAGVFSTADDLAVFAQMLINGGVSRYRGQEQGRSQGQSQERCILSPAALGAMLKPHTMPGSATLRALGWDIRSPYSREHTACFPEGSFGHTGYTGTSLWIDPRSKTFLIILTNRLYPDGKGQVKSMRARTAAAVAAVVNMGPPADATISGDAYRSDMSFAGHGQSDGPEPVRTGIDVLASSGFASLVGKSIGVITNHTGIDASGRSTLNVLLHAPGVKVRAIFSPEHGLSGNLDEKVSSRKDSSTGLPVYSLYGDVKRPTAAMLHGLDALVYDIQDVGTRFYTYITTMAYAMESAAAAGLDFYVLDRPNPLTASVVQGPVLDPSFKSFVGYFPLPVRYGMTAGELARLFNSESKIGAKLHVIRMEGYRRETWLDDNALPWINPSPNIRSLTQAILYPGVAMIESANVSVGRGTDSPFEVIGAPWISGEQLARYLSGRHIAGIVFEPVSFVPHSDRFKTGGVRASACTSAIVPLSIHRLLASSWLRPYTASILEIFKLSAPSA